MTVEEVRNSSACNFALALIALSTMPADCSTAGRRYGYKELICPGTFSAFMAALTGAAASMAKHQKRADPENRDCILKARNNFRRHNIAGNTCDKNVTNRLVKHQLDGYARVGAG